MNRKSITFVMSRKHCLVYICLFQTLALTFGIWGWIMMRRGAALCSVERLSVFLAYPLEASAPGIT